MLIEQLALISRRNAVPEVLFEDAHWIGFDSIELIDKTVRRVADLPVMIIVTYRPEFTPPWLDLG